MRDNLARGDDLEERFVQFAVAIVKFCSRLPNNHAGRHFAGQLLRSGSSPAANYAEARGAESKKDFIHKLKIVQKELNESATWLKIINRCELMSTKEIEPISQECTELSKIVTASINTAAKGT